MILAFILVSCAKSQKNSTIFLTKNTPENMGVKSELINNLIADIEVNKIKNIHGLLIIKDDKLITEEYFGDLRRDELHYSASVSKSFASTLLGIAIDKGFFDDDIPTVLNKNVSELFPEYSDIIENDSMKKELKLKHILSMTAGFEWDEHTYPYTDNRNDCNRINNNNDPMKFLFERKLIYKPGSEFYYNGGLSLSISYLIEKYTGMSVDKFADQYLFAPLGIKDYRWDNVANGLIDTDGGLYLKPIDQAKLGYLFLNEGIWQDKQIVSEEWVNETTKVQHTNTDMPDYAYQWWCGDFNAINRTFFTYFASGHGGQKVLVFPEFNMVIVITQQVFNNPFGDLNFIAILSDYILPAVTGKDINNEVISIPEKELAKFEGHYISENNDEYIDVEIKNNTLLITSSNGEKNEFIPILKNIFKTRILDLVNIQIEFVNDKDKNIKVINSNFGFMNKQFIKSN